MASGRHGPAHRLELGIDLSPRSQELLGLRLGELWTLPEIELVESVADLGQSGQQFAGGQLYGWYFGNGRQCRGADQVGCGRLDKESVDHGESPKIVVRARTSGRIDVVS
jgi:hypothetical protein